MLLEWKESTEPSENVKAAHASAGMTCPYWFFSRRWPGVLQTQETFADRKTSRLFFPPDEVSVFLSAGGSRGNGDLSEGWGRHGRRRHRLITFSVRMPVSGEMASPSMNSGECVSRRNLPRPGHTYSVFPGTEVSLHAGGLVETAGKIRNIFELSFRRTVRV